jgi:uncharacterized membrane protein YiaA
MVDVLKPYAKALVALAAGVVVFLVGVIADDDTLKQIGIGAIAASPLVYGVKNG